MTSSKNKNTPHSAQKSVVLCAFLASLALQPKTLNAMGGGGGCVSGNIIISLITPTLNFATISPCAATAGQVTVRTNNGTLTTSGCISSTQGTAQRANVRVTGGQSSSTDKVVIRVPTGAISISAGANTMSVTELGLKQGGGKQFTITQNGNATNTYPIGGTLNVGGGQAGGTYSGTAAVTVTCL